MKYMGDMYDIKESRGNPKHNEFDFSFERTRTGKNNLEYNYNIIFEKEKLKITPFESKQLYGLSPVLKNDIYYEEICDISYGKETLLTFNDIFSAFFSIIISIGLCFLTFSDLGLKVLFIPLAFIFSYILILFCKTSKVIKLKVYDDDGFNFLCIPYTTSIFSKTPEYIEKFYSTLEYRISDTYINYLRED